MKKIGLISVAAGLSISWGMVAAGLAVDALVHHRSIVECTALTVIAVCGFTMTVLACAQVADVIVDSIIDERFEDADETQPLVWNDGNGPDDEELLGRG